MDSKCKSDEGKLQLNLQHIITINSICRPKSVSLFCFVAFSKYVIRITGTPSWTLRTVGVLK
jgi:hypothetical protein